MPYILSLSTSDEGSSSSLSPRIRKDDEENEEFIATVSKSYLGNKPIYSIFVRGSSKKEVI